MNKIPIYTPSFDDTQDKGRGYLVTTMRLIPTRLRCECGKIFDAPSDPGIAMIVCPKCRRSEEAEMTMPDLVA